MGEEITTIDISNAEELSASSFTNVKNSINIKIDNSGDLTDTNDNAVTMLNFGNRGDHCVTVINAELPSNFSEGYRAYFLVNLKNKTYIQKCLMEGNIAKALITKEISLDSQSTECLFALIEASATTGNLREQEEIFISDVFMGTVRSNFLDSNWMDADISVSEDLTVLDKFETPNPDKYTSMVWVNGETKLNAANMNNIIKGIDELKEQAVEVNPSDTATELLSKIKVNDTVLASGKTYIFDDIITDGTLKDGIFNEILQLISMGCSNITILQSDLLFTFVGLGAAMKSDNMVVGLVFRANMVVYPTDTEKHSMCAEFTLFQDNTVSDGETFNLPEPPAYSSDIQDKVYNLELRYTDSVDSFMPKWTEKTTRTLIKDGTYHSKNGDIVFNTISFTDEEIAQINNKEIDAISGNFILEAGENNVSQTDYFVRFDGSRFMSYRYDIDDFNTYVHYTVCALVLMEGNQAILMQSESKTAFVPQAPQGPEENNKILVTNNGKLVYEDKPNSVEANPSDAATATLSKLKVGNTTYGIGSDEIVEANGTFMSVEDETGTIINTISFDNNIVQKIKEGKIKVIYGYLQNFEADNEPDYFYCTLNGIQDAQTNYPTYYYRQEGNDLDKEIFTYAISISFSDEEPPYTAVLGKVKNGNLLPSLPLDASSKTYTLRLVDGHLTWVDTSVGTQKFENVEVSGTITAGGKSLNAVEANPADAATTSLNKIKIGNVVYNIVGSSSSGGSSGSDSSAGDSGFVAFEENNIITNGRVNDGVFQNLTNLINAHKVPVIVGDQRTYSYSGMATSPDGSKNGLAFTAEVHMYDASSYTYFSGQLPLILWSDNSISEDAMAFGSIPTPPYNETGTKQYVLSGTDMGLAWIDIDEKISSAITSTLEADY